MNEVIIFYRERKIVLKQTILKDFSAGNDHVFIHQNSERTKAIINTFFENEQIKEIIFVDDDILRLLNAVKALFTYIEAAGGLVRNQLNELLVIHRFGRPDLPKGKSEKKETPQETAIREVEEECGISTPVIVESLEPTYHIYFVGSEKFLKKTFWFNMKYSGNEKPIPQQKEGIIAVEWCNESKIKEYQKHTYPSIVKYFS